VDAFVEPPLTHATSPSQELCPTRQGRILCRPHSVPLCCGKFAKSQAKLMVNLISFSTFEAPGEFSIFSALDSSVADPRYFSLIPDPDFFYIPEPGSRISDPVSSNNKKRIEKNKLVLTFRFSHKFHKTNSN
jgi:hypothetical protein